MRMKNNASMRQTIKDIVRTKVAYDNFFGSLFDAVNEATVSLNVDAKYEQFVETCRKELIDFKNPGPLVLKAAYQFIDDWKPENVARAVTVATHTDPIDPHLVYENPFLKYIQIPTADIGSYHFGKQTYAPYTFIIDQTPAESLLSKIDHFGLLEDSLSIPLITYPDHTISVTPYEMNDYQAAIDQMRGNVAVIGLKLGYFVYMAHLKNEVNHLTVIESSQEIIDYFYKYLLPQFDHPEKITVIHGSYFDHTDLSADLYFVDAYTNAKEGLRYYMAVKPFEMKNHLSVYYSDEANILDEMKLQLLMRIMDPTFYKDIPQEQYDEICKDNKMTELDPFFDQLKIKSPAQLRGLFKRTGIRQTINHFYKRAS